MQCANCGRENRPSAQSCSSCGSALLVKPRDPRWSAWRCPNCRSAWTFGEMRRAVRRNKCPRCGATIVEQPSSEQEPRSFMGEVWAGFAFFLLSVNGWLVLCLLPLGFGFAQAFLVANFGYRPIGWSETILGVLWIVAVVFYALISMPFFLVWLRKPPDSPLVAIGIIFLAGAPVMGAYLVFMPTLQESLHLSNWPAELPLTSFEVCGTDFKIDEFNKSIEAHGTIAFEIANRSPRYLKEATFTVKTGYPTDFLAHSAIYQFTIRDLAPNSARRVEKKAHLGLIVAQVGAGDMPGDETSARASILWDHVRFDGTDTVRLASRPENASLIVDACPGYQVPVGAWKPWLRKKD